MSPVRCSKTQARVAVAALGAAAAALAALCCAIAASAETPAPLPEVTVEAQRVALEQRVENFVRRVTQNPGFSDESLIRWNVPICLFAIGLSAEDSRAVLARLSQIISAAGAPLAPGPCRPNFAIIVTSDPDRVLEAWYKRDSQLFGSASPSDIRHFLDGSHSRPIHVWRNIDRGRTAGTRFGHFVPSNNRAESSPFERNAVLGFYSIFAIIDSNRVEHANQAQLTDYVAMAGLSNVDLDADIGNAPSILQLFAASGDRPDGLSLWDTAFLKALYQSDQTSRSQRHEIAERVIREVSR